MDRMTREKVEYLIGQFALLAARADWKPKSIDRIRAFGDLALRALDRDAVLDGAVREIIDELAAIADACVDLQQNRRRPDSDPVMGWDNARLTLGTLRKARALKREPSAAPQEIESVVYHYGNLAVTVTGKNIGKVRVYSVTDTNGGVYAPGASDE